MTIGLPLLAGVVHAAESGDAGVFEEIAKPPPAGEKIKFYRSPSERREAGLGRKVTDWLSVSGLVELEAEFEEFEFSGNKSDNSNHISTKSLQLGLNFTLTEDIAAEFVFEYEVDSNLSLLDEGIIKYEGEMLGVEAGLLYVPFGEYYSHFVTGPILEIGETRGGALVVEYSLTDAIDIFAYGIAGESEKQGESGGQLDWGGGFEFASRDESVKINAGYNSDMADTDERFLDDFGNKYQHRVGGITANTLIGMDTYEITAEYLGTLGKFNELEGREDRPWAANLEVAWYPLNDFQFAARIEASSEVPDEPKIQYGVSATWLIAYRVNFSIDYLYGRFRKDFAFDDDDNEISSRQLVAAQLNFVF